MTFQETSLTVPVISAYIPLIFVGIISQLKVDISHWLNAYYKSFHLGPASLSAEPHRKVAMEVPEWLLAAYPNRTWAELAAIGRSNAYFFVPQKNPVQRLDEDLSKHHKTRSHSCFSWNFKCCFRILTSKIVQKWWNHHHLKFDKHIPESHLSPQKVAKSPAETYQNPSIRRSQKSRNPLGVSCRGAKIWIHCADWIWHYINP